MTEKELDQLLARLGITEEAPSEGKKGAKKNKKPATASARSVEGGIKDKGASDGRAEPRQTPPTERAGAKRAERTKSAEHTDGREGKRDKAVPSEQKESAKRAGAKEPAREAKSKPLPRKDEGGVKAEGAKPQKGNAPRGKERKKEGAPLKKEALRIIPLGGLEEIGKNITLLEYGKDIIVVDCGMGFPDEDMPGVDLVLPDFTYLQENADRVRGILLTHGHEDHIGGVPYLLRSLCVPVYGTRLTLGILRKKLEEFRYEKKNRLMTVSAGDVVRLGAFMVEFIHVNHSIADSCALAIHTPVGTVLHSGDFKLDVSPIDGQMMDLARLSALGDDGVRLLLAESTNAERSGFTPSERTVGSSLEHIFLKHKNKRLVIATFSSNVHRVQQIIDASARHKRRVAILGRSMVNVIGAARELGYMEVPDGVLIDVSEIKRFRPEEITLVTTGSQGEPMSALYRMAFGEHDRVKLDGNDVVVISASAIPGNEKYVGNIVNALVKNGIGVIDDSSFGVHVSGHACSEELKLLHALIRPEHFMPIHGESRHLYAHKAIAEFMGMPASHIHVLGTGDVLELDGEGGVKRGESVVSGNVLVDGSGVGDVGEVVLRDRKHLAEDGLIVAVAVIDKMSKSLLSEPDLITRGFVFVKESGELLDEARETVRTTLLSMLRRGTTDTAELRGAVKDALGRLLFRKTKRRPMVLPMITEL